MQDKNQWYDYLTRRFCNHAGKFYTTSGTTSIGKVYLYPEFTIKKCSEVARSFLEGLEFGSHRTIAIFWGFGSFAPSDFYAIALLEMGHKVFQMGSGLNMPTNQKIYWMKKYSINCIIATPSYLSKFITALKQDIDFSKIRDNIETVITGGELLSPHLRKIIEDDLECKVFDHYGMTEAPMVAGECLNGHMHVSPEYYPEVLQDNAVIDLGEGELLLSSNSMWENTKMVRLKTNDLVSLEDIVCEYSSNKVIRLKGRNDNLIKIKGALIDFNIIIDYLNSKGLVNYCFNVYVNQSQGDRLVLEVENESVDLIRKDTNLKLLISITFEIKICSFNTESNSKHKYIKVIS